MVINKILSRANFNLITLYLCVTVRVCTLRADRLKCVVLKPLVSPLTIMTSRISQMYQNLAKCAESLEEDVMTSLQQLNTPVESVVALEASKDYHYKEILDHLQQIKNHITIIAGHDRSIQDIQNKINGNPSKIDKNYIKKQVETFQNFGVVNKREHKRVRPPETSSMRLLECWERIMEEEGVKDQPSQALPLVIKREESLRRRRKVLSSTVDTFLESPSDKSTSKTMVSSSVNIFLERPSDKGTSKTEVARRSSNSVEAVNEVITDTKPRIVDVIYKKNVNGQI